MKSCNFIHWKDSDIQTSLSPIEEEWDKGQMTKYMTNTERNFFPLWMTYFGIMANIFHVLVWHFHSYIENVPTGNEAVILCTIYYH